MKENTKLNDDSARDAGKGFGSLFSMDANVHVELRGPDGALKDERLTHNAVTTDGLYGVIAQCASTPGLPVAKWMELGEGTGGPTSKKLVTVLAASRHELVAPTGSYTRTDDVLTYEHTWAAGEATGAITEAGLFDVVTADTANAWLYVDFAVINVGALDTLKITWTLTIS